MSTVAYIKHLFRGKGYVMDSYSNNCTIHNEPSHPGKRSRHRGPTANTATLDKAIGLLIEREESLLSDIVEQCNSMVMVAEEQAWDMATLLEDQP